MEPETVECKYCKTETSCTGTGLFDRCWELETRVLRNPELTLLILREKGVPVE